MDEKDIKAMVHKMKSPLSVIGTYLSAYAPKDGDAKDTFEAALNCHKKLVAIIEEMEGKLSNQG